MRVLHIVDGIGVGGAELVLLQLIERLQKRGVQNHVLSLTKVSILRDRILASGAELKELDARKGRLPIGQIGQMRRYLRSCKADVLKGWMYHGNFATMVLRDISFLKTPMVWSVHNTLEKRPEFSRVTKLAYLACRHGGNRPERIVYVSRVSQRQHEERGFKTEKSLYIPNGTDCDRFKPNTNERTHLRGELGLDADLLILGCFARWHPMKGHAKLIEAAGRITREGLPLHLVFAGTDMTEENADLLALIDAENLRARCTFLGERQDMERLYAGIDGFVLPSVHSEAFPMVLGEAMASELPVISTDIGDSAELVGDAGRIVPAGDVEALANAITELHKSGPSNRNALGKAARARIISQFSLDRMVDAYHQLFEEVSKGATAHDAQEKLTNG